MHDELRQLKIGAVSPTIINDIRYLGFRQGVPTVDWNSKLAFFKKLVNRIAASPLSMESRAQIIASRSIPKLLRGCELSTLCDSSLQSLRALVLKSLWIGRSRFRNRR